MRKGREFYSTHYKEAMNLYKKGVSVKEIAKKLGISYSCAYHWVKEIRKPEAGNINEFTAFLEKNGPTPVIDINEKFPKHNEIFLTASRRGLPLKRHVLKRKYRDYATWYYIKGQDEELEKRIDELMEKVSEMKEKLRKSFSDE